MGASAKTLSTLLTQPFQVVPEIVSSGSQLTTIPIAATSRNYLTPKQFHDALLTQDVTLIDCRNDKECKIGGFSGGLSAVVNPGTKTFHEFPQWVRDNSTPGGVLSNPKKKVVMYCTGGIRCEKASAFVRDVTGNDDVWHLEGGVHRYLEEYGKDGVWEGKNFMFDGRGGVGEDGGPDACTVVGKCCYCEKAWDVFGTGDVCSVCREQVLCCEECRARLAEVHCGEHWDLRECYFTELAPFSDEVLNKHRALLQGILDSIAVGKVFKSRRKTIVRQLNKIAEEIQVRPADYVPSEGRVCRSCFKEGCGGACWGYFGNNRKEAAASLPAAVKSASGTRVSHQVRQNKQQSALRKEAKDKEARDEILDNGLFAPLSSFRAPTSASVRIVPPFKKTVSCCCKGKWIGNQVRSVIVDEFNACSDDAENVLAMEKGLIRVNDAIVGRDYKVKMGDVISRIVHWHEPPVYCAKPSLDIKPVALPTGEVVYVVDKPCTMPTHSAGQYLGNSLSIIAEKELELEVRSLAPVMRLDKCTSGVVVLAGGDGRKVLAKKIEMGEARKCYVACVRGDFGKQPVDNLSGLVKCEEGVWCRNPLDGFSLVDNERGKKSLSFFRHVAYDEATKRSVILCFPKTGRGHQLRVHLQHLGYPICGDLMYGGCEGDEVNRESAGAALDGFKMTTAEVGRLCAGGDEERAAGELLDCVYCMKGFEEGFNKTQLLQGGSAICLHAWKYEVEFGEGVVVAFEVEGPTWGRRSSEALNKAVLLSREF